MSNAPDLATQVARVGNSPNDFNKRERRLLQSAKAYIDSLTGGLDPAAIALYSGTFTTAGGDASEAITVTGALATDIVMVSVKTAGATPRSIVAATAASNAINVTLSGDPSTDHVLQYVVFRAAS